MPKPRDEFTAYPHHAGEFRDKHLMIRVVLGDITQIKADVIVNAANSNLLGGGGVDGAIHRAAGPELLKECQEIRKNIYPNGLPIGQAVATKRYNLHTKIIVHTVGPKYYSQDINLLKNCYLNSLKIAEENNCSSIAFPAISTGAYGVPIEKSAEIVSGILKSFKSKNIEEIILVLHTKEDFEVYQKTFQNLQ